MWDMTFSFVGHDSFTRSTHANSTLQLLILMERDSFRYVTRIIHMWDITHPHAARMPTTHFSFSSFMVHLSLIYLERNIFTCRTHANNTSQLLIFCLKNSAWLLHMCDMNHSYVRHALSTCRTRANNAPQTPRYRVAKTHKMPYLYHVPQKSPVISGSFVKRDLHLGAPQTPRYKVAKIHRMPLSL